MSSAHIGDNAELYAFGALDRAEREAVEAHLAQCDECLRLVGRAEETLLAMERESREVPIPASDWRPRAQGRPIAASWWMVAVAAAAAFVVGILVPHGSSTQDEARVAMLNSHFNHAQFSGTPLAKVLYPRERTWYYVIVDGTQTYEVYGISKAGAADLGATKAAGATTELFVRSLLRFDRIELRDAGKTVESAAIR